MPGITKSRHIYNAASVALVALTAFLLAGVCLIAHAVETPDPEAVRALTGKVADWQMATFDNHGKYRALPTKRDAQRYNHENYHDLTWQMGALYVGMNQWRGIADNPDKYTDFLIKIGERNGWRPHKRPYHADDHAVGHFYLSLYEDIKNPAMLKPTREHFDWILENPKTGSLIWSWKTSESRDRWGWCDALFMAPPVWTRLAKITGDRKYLEFMDQEYRVTSELLWDTDESLFWRDSSFFEQREKNGEKVFWARGNGWVFGGLALMIPDMPVNWDGREFYTDIFKRMAVRLKELQREDGTWSMGLLGDPADYPNKETSGTSFFTFGLAWGINAGILDRAVYEPVVMGAWRALEASVTEEGMLVWVQPIGAAPGESFPNASEVYGVGAFLAAGAEVHRMLRIKYKLY